MTTRLITMVAAAQLCAGAFAAECKCGKAECGCGDKCECTAAECKCGGCQTPAAEEGGEGWAWAMGEGVTFDETPIVSAEVSLAFDSKFMSYGLVDNNEPILTPGASLTFFDWVTFGVEAIFDTTHYGRHDYGEGYGSRKFRYQELDPGVTIGHAFGPDDADWLPTTIEFELGYMYEAHPKIVDDDTQFVTFSVGLPDLWIEPVFSAEFDIERDHGTYLNIEIGHTFALIDGDAEEEEGGDPLLDFRVSLSQGWGDKQRVAAYLSDVNLVNEDGEYEELSHAGLMDTCLKGELGWNVCDGVRLSCYVAYYDYLFDQPNRDGAKVYEAWGDWTESWNFVAGASLAVTF